MQRAAKQWCVSAGDSAMGRMDTDAMLANAWGKSFAANRRSGGEYLRVERAELVQRPNPRVLFRAAGAAAGEFGP